MSDTCQRWFTTEASYKKKAEMKMELFVGSDQYGYVRGTDQVFGDEENLTCEEYMWGYWRNDVEDVLPWRYVVKEKRQVVGVMREDVSGRLRSSRWSMTHYLLSHDDGVNCSLPTMLHISSQISEFVRHTNVTTYLKIQRLSKWQSK